LQPINEVFSIVSSSFSSASGCSFLFSEANPLQFDYVLDIGRHGIRLRFDSPSQRLKAIVIKNVHGLVLSYRNTVFSSPKIVSVLPPPVAMLYVAIKPHRWRREDKERGDRGHFPFVAIESH